MKHLLRILLWVVGIVLALLLLLSLVAGPVARGYLNRHGEQLVGRRVAVDHVGLNLFSGSVAVRGLTLYEDDGSTPFAGFDTLSVRARLLQLPFRTVNLRRLTLAGFHASLLQEGDRFNFSSLLDHFASDSSSDSEPRHDTASSPWTLKFYNIRLSHASLLYRDLRGNKELSLPDINLQVPGFVLGGKEQTEGGLNLSFDKGGGLRAEAHYDAGRGTCRAQLDLADFDLRNIEGYVRDFVALDHVDGTLSAHVSLDGRTDDLLKSRIGASLALADLDLREGHASVASLHELGVTVSSIDLEANRYDLDEVHLDGLAATYEQWQGYSNISRLMKPAAEAGPEEAGAPSGPTAAPAEPAAQKAPMRLHLGHLRVENCSLTYVDHTLPDLFRFPVTGITLTADDLSLDGENSARLRASLPGGGHLAVRWQGDLDHWKRHQDLFLTIKGLDLRQLSPWAVAYTGQPIEEGIFSLTSRNSIHNSNLSGKNNLDIYKASVGKRRKGVDARLSLPLKAALYVLKDKDDKILIDMPVKGNVDNPEFNYMKVVWKTLGNLVVKVATSPARAIGNALGFGSDNLDFLPIDPAQHGLTSEQYHLLGELATIARSDSLVVLTLEQHMPEAASDSVAFRYAMWNDLVRRYMAEQGVSDSQLVVSQGEATHDGEATGYAVSSEMKIEE